MALRYRPRASERSQQSVFYQLRWQAQFLHALTQATEIAAGADLPANASSVDFWSSRDEFQGQLKNLPILTGTVSRVAILPISPLGFFSLPIPHLGEIACESAAPLTAAIARA